MPDHQGRQRLVEREGPEVWDILEEVIREHPLLESRADAASLGIQAFEPVLIRARPSSCISLCTAFNADSTATRWPYTPLPGAAEARALMMTPTTSSARQRHPIIVPSVDVVLGSLHDSRKGGRRERHDVPDTQEVSGLRRPADRQAKVKVRARMGQSPDGVYTEKTRGSPPRSAAHCRPRSPKACPSDLVEPGHDEEDLSPRRSTRRALVGKDGSSTSSCTRASNTPRVRRGGWAEFDHRDPGTEDQDRRRGRQGREGDPGPVRPVSSPTASVQQGGRHLVTSQRSGRRA